jgi:hypothetical protein
MEPPNQKPDPQPEEIPVDFKDAVIDADVPEAPQPEPDAEQAYQSAVERWGRPVVAPEAPEAPGAVVEPAPPAPPRPDYVAISNRWLTWLGPALLLVFAFFYYQQYYLSGLNLGGEGGTNAVIAMRLLEGQRPIADTFLGYNVMWFYPLVWLFQAFGPDFTAMRIFFYLVSAVTGVIAFGTVRRVTGQAWLALGCGVLVILLPGMLFRNYMGFFPVLNGFVLLSAFVFEASTPGRRFAWYVIAGFTLGWTFLTRIDVGVFFLPIYLGVAVLWPLAVRGRFWHRIPEAVAGLLTVVLVAGALHMPFWTDARERGFEKNFVNQYLAIWGLIQYEAKKHIIDKVMLFDPSAAVGETGADRGPSVVPLVRTEAAGPGESMPAAGEGSESGTRPRPAVDVIWGDGSLSDKAFVAALYLPLVIGGVIFLFSAIGLMVGIFSVREDLKRDAMAAGVLLGAALTLFPQYFFFRPDTPHLAEFRIPFLIAMVCASFLAVRWLWCRSVVMQLVVSVFILMCAVCEGAFFYHAYFKDSSGSVRVMHNRTAPFTAENGVRALIRKRDVDWMNGLRDSILEHSTPTDWLVTYPYSPTINFMTNRRSYLYNLYVDNATAQKDFHAVTMREIAEFRPAIVVIDDRPINNTEMSKFSRWAAPTMKFLRDEYVQIGQFNSIAVFARPDKAPKKLNPDVAPTL